MKQAVLRQWMRESIFGGVLTDLPDATDFFYLASFVQIFKVLEEEEHAKAEPTEPNAVFDGLSPEEFAAQFFGGGSVREPQEGLTSFEWLKGQFKTKSAIRYLHSALGGAHPPKVIAKSSGVAFGTFNYFREYALSEVRSLFGTDGPGVWQSFGSNDQC
jgi:hypothetical protein